MMINAVNIRRIPVCVFHIYAWATNRQKAVHWKRKIVRQGHEKFSKQIYSQWKVLVQQKWWAYRMSSSVLICIAMLFWIRLNGFLTETHLMDKRFCRLLDQSACLSEIMTLLQLYCSVQPAGVENGLVHWQLELSDALASATLRGLHQCYVSGIIGMLLPRGKESYTSITFSYNTELCLSEIARTKKPSLSTGRGRICRTHAWIQHREREILYLYTATLKQCSHTIT